MMTSNIGFESKDALKKKIFLFVSCHVYFLPALSLYFCVANSFGNDFMINLICFEGSFPVALVSLHTSHLSLFSSFSTFYLSVTSV